MSKLDDDLIQVARAFGLTIRLEVYGAIGESSDYRVLVLKDESIMKNGWKWWLFDKARRDRKNDLAGNTPLELVAMLHQKTWLFMHMELLPQSVWEECIRREGGAPCLSVSRSP